jgi:hypothetical protein
MVALVMKSCAECFTGVLLPRDSFSDRQLQGVAMVADSYIL